MTPDPPGKNRAFSPTIPDQLFQARKNLALTQSAVAEKVGLSQSALAKIESGASDVPLSRVIEISRILGLELLLVPKNKLIAVNSILKDIESADPFSELSEFLGVAESGEDNDSEDEL